MTIIEWIADLLLWLLPNKIVWWILGFIGLAVVAVLVIHSGAPK